VTEKYHLVHIHLLERALEKLKVLDVLVLEICSELDLLEEDTAWEQHVHELAISCPSAQLLNFAIAELQAIIYPVQHLMPT